MIIDFKQATVDDAGLLVDIYNASFFSDYRRFGSCPGYGKTIEMMEESIRLYSKHIILCDNKPVGCVSCHSNAPQEYEIGSLCVIPEYQGKGIGTQAIQFVKNYYDDWKRLTLVTPLYKRENIRFYTEKCGFQIVGTEKDGNVELARFLMERLYITHYFYPGTDPWKNIMLLPEDEAFRVAGELAAAHPETTSFGRFADFRNYYPARKKADEYVRAGFIALGGKPVLAHPYSFTLMDCEYLRKWFSNGEKIVLNLEDIPDDQISFTIGDSCAQITNGTEPEVLTKEMLMKRIHDCGDSVNSFLEGSLGKFAYVEVQLWNRPVSVCGG